MAYLTSADLETRVGGVDPFRDLTDDDEDGSPDTAVITQVLTELDSFLDFYFRAGGYTVPLTVAAFTGVKHAALDIANYRLKTRGDRSASEADRQKYEDALAVLHDVAKRVLLLDIAVSVTAVDYSLESDEPIFDRETLAVL